MPFIHPTLIIITGAPASGKTTLARHLATALDLPLLYRDGLKEVLFDTLGWQDRAWSQRLGGASYELLYYTLDLLLKTDCSCIVESNFTAAASAKLSPLIERHGYAVVQIVCRADSDVLRERFRQRTTAGQRHPGHVDDVALNEMDDALLVRFGPLDLPGNVIELDTTDVAADDYVAVIAQIRTLG